MTHGIELLHSPGIRRMVAAGLLAALFGAGAYAIWRPAAPRYYRATLEASSSPCAMYFSTWDEGEVFLDHDASDGKTVVFQRTFTWFDGCTWESQERLDPLTADRYFYRYDERVVSCPAGRSPRGFTTPRAGLVTLQPVAGARRVTAAAGALPGVNAYPSIEAIAPVADDEASDDETGDDEDADEAAETADQ